MTEIAYPRLAGLVDGREVAVLGRKHAPAALWPGEVSLRFNDDSEAADILATTFDVPVAAPPGALLLATVPRAEFDAAPLGRVNLLGPEHPHAAGHAAPIEPVARPHWEAMRVEQPLWPLSGAVALAMLERTAVARVRISGFDFYRGAPTRLASLLHEAHDLPAALAAMAALLARDARFVWEGAPLGELLLERVAEQAAAARRLLAQAWHAAAGPGAPPTPPGPLDRPLPVPPGDQLALPFPGGGPGAGFHDLFADPRVVDRPRAAPNPFCVFGPWGMFQLHTDAGGLGEVSLEWRVEGLDPARRWRWDVEAVTYGASPLQLSLKAGSPPRKAAIALPPGARTALSVPVPVREGVRLRMSLRRAALRNSASGAAARIIRAVLLAG